MNFEQGESKNIEAYAMHMLKDFYDPLAEIQDTSAEMEILNRL